MVVNKKVTGRAQSIPAGIGIGTAVSLLITLIGSFIAAWLVNGQIIEEGTIGYCSIVILLASAMAGAYTAQAVIKHQRLTMCAAAGACYYISLLAATALFFGGQYHGMGVTALVVACGCGVVILLGLKGRGTHNPKLKKYRYG